MKMNKIILSSITIATLSLCAYAESNKAVSFEDIKDGLSATEFREYGISSPTSVETRLGTLNFTKGGFAGGYPTLETSEKLKAELDFQRAVQAYIWAVPLVSYYNWFEAQKSFGAKDGGIVQYKTAIAK